MTDTPKTTEPKADPRAEVDELEKIMSEIEELQNELEVTSTPVVAAASTDIPSATALSADSDTATATATENDVTDAEDDDILKDIQSNGLVDESNMEETLAELKSEDTGSSLLDSADAGDILETDQEEEMAEIPMSSNNNGNSGSGNDGSLTMTLTGNMTLKLKYEYEGQEVTISFADQTLRVQMSDGTEFKVPVSRISQNNSQASNVKPFKKTG